MKNIDPQPAPRRIIGNALRQSLNASHQTRVSGSGSGSFVAPPDSYTTPVDVDDGSAGDNHPFILGIDGLQDSDAFLKVP